MKQPKGYTEYGKDGCCPHEWDHVPEMTGYYTMDAAIMRGHNKDMHAKLSDHLVNGPVYHANTAYGRTDID